MSESTQPRHLRLAGTVAAPRQARDFLAAACADWRAERFAEPAALALSELVSNAVLHAGTDLDLTLRLAGDRLLMRIRDGSPVPPEPAGPRPSGAGGHGLGIVARLAESWGVDPDAQGGKVVWCVLKAE